MEAGCICQPLLVCKFLFIMQIYGYNPINRKCDFSYVKGMYTIISDFLTWIDPEIMPSLKEVDKVCKIIEKEENKQKQ